jgi:RND family efflux transporter MFP subunit
MTPSTTKSRARLGLLGGVGLLTILAGFGIWSREHAEGALAAATKSDAVPLVAVATPSAEPPVDEVVLPGTVKAEFDTPIYARTNGYVKRWYVDIGAHVTAGQLLAEIDAPEVDQALRQAEADLGTAEANNQAAQATAQRVRALLPTDSVSKEQGDVASSDAAAKASAVASNQANVARLKQLVGFERVTAPYAGVVTARETDNGNLINAGSGSGPELFRVADTHLLRIYVQVPQSYAARVRPGVEVSLQFPEYPGRSFPAKLTRTADAIDPTARTLLVELEADNAKGELFPGGYVEVHFALPVAQQGLTLSGNTLLFRQEGLRVAAVGPDGRVVLKPIRLGRDFGTKVEVATGIGPNDRVILNPPASIETGDLVRVASSHADKGAKS